MPFCVNIVKVANFTSTSKTILPKAVFLSKTAYFPRREFQTLEKENFCLSKFAQCRRRFDPRDEVTICMALKRGLFLPVKGGKSYFIKVKTFSLQISKLLQIMVPLILFFK